MPEYRFDEIALNLNEKRMPTPDDKYSYIGLEHLDSGKLEVTRWGSEVDITGQKLVMRKGDILFGRRNTYLRRVAIAPHDGLFSAHGMIFRPNTMVINEKLFPFFIASDYFMNAAIRISVGSLSPTVNWSALKELRFKLPRLESQSELSEQLYAANETKVAYKQLLTQTDELVKSRFVEMFDGGQFDERTVEDVCESIFGGGTPTKSKPEYYTGEIPWVTPKDMKSVVLLDSIDHITEEAVKNSTVKMVPQKSVLMVIRSGILKHDLPIAINTVPVTVNQDMKAFVVGKEITPEYLMYAFVTREAKILSNVRAVTADNIEFGVIKNMRIPIPPIEAQRRFAVFAEAANKSKFELQQTIERVTNLMRSLMQQDFL